MFEINTQRTVEDSVQLLEESRKLKGLRLEAGSTVAILDSLSGMENVTDDLRRLLFKIEDQQDSFDQLTKTLDIINYCYISTENRTADNVEHRKIVFERKRINEITIEAISKYLNGMYIE